MSKKVKILLGCGGTMLLLAACVCTGVVGLGGRYYTAGVNPLREIREMAWGETIEVKEQPEPKGQTYRVLMVDGINRGNQFVMDPSLPRAKQPFDKVRLPTTYFHPHGPVGIAMEKIAWFDDFDHTNLSDVRFPANLVMNGGLSPLPQLCAVWSEPPYSVIGLNNGTMAAYARPGQTVDFYERSPRIIELSAPKDLTQTAKFTYLEDAKKRGANVRVFEGNERQRYEKEAPKAFYHIVFVETSHGHPGLPSKELLTKEALKLYFDSMVESGVVCFHVSSRDFRIGDVLAATSNELGFAHVHMNDMGSSADRRPEYFSSEWVLVARREIDLEYLKRGEERRAHLRDRNRQPPLIGQLRVGREHVWTDAGSNSLVPLKRDHKTPGR